LLKQAAATQAATYDDAAQMARQEYDHYWTDIQYLTLQS
jgi:hypothetical protein